MQQPHQVLPHTPQPVEAIRPFDGVDPSVILAMLGNVKKEECINGKLFWKTYGVKWESLSIEQRNKTVVFWNTNITQEMRNKILSDAREKILIDLQDESTRQAITTKHDNSWF